MSEPEPAEGKRRSGTHQRLWDLQLPLVLTWSLHAAGLWNLSQVRQRRHLGRVHGNELNDSTQKRRILLENSYIYICICMYIYVHVQLVCTVMPKWQILHMTDSLADLQTRRCEDKLKKPVSQRVCRMCCWVSRVFQLCEIPRLFLFSTSAVCLH